MIDATARHDLSLNLRRLVTGRMTNDEFDEFVYFPLCDSKDLAVRWIAEFGYCLYSSDLLKPYRLAGRHAVSTEERQTAARCVLFLRTRLEYEWPSKPDSLLVCLVQSLAYPFGIALGITLALLSLALVVTGDWPEATLWFILAAAGVLLSSAWLAFVYPERWYAPRWEAFCQSGDYDVWPFLRRGDFEAARRPRQSANS